MFIPKLRARSARLSRTLVAVPALSGTLLFSACAGSPRSGDTARGPALRRSATPAASSQRSATPAASSQLLRFEGNRAFTTEQLLAATCVEFPPGCEDFRGRSQEELIRAAPHFISQAYENQGFAAVQVADPQPETGPNGAPSWVIRIVEGRNFVHSLPLVQEVDAEGRPRRPAPDEPPLPPLREPRAGELYRQRELSEMALGLQADLEDLGYGRANVEVTPELNPDAGTVTGALRIHRGPFVTFRAARAESFLDQQAEAQRIVQALVGTKFSRTRVEQLRAELRQRCPGDVLQSSQADGAKMDIMFLCWKQ